MNAGVGDGGAGAAPDLPELPDLTPARVLLGRAGTGYRTSTALRLRADHAAARDALHEPLDLGGPALGPLVARHDLFEVATMAPDLATHLARPDLGRRLTPEAVATLRVEVARGADLQVLLGDGLSARAVHAQAPALLPLLLDGAGDRGWSVGRPFAVRHCRVGVLDDVGEALGAVVVVLLVGERPGLATAESLSAYMAYRPHPGCTDADRNLVSNIHGSGVAPAAAARRILALADEMRLQQRSGVQLVLPAGDARLDPGGFDPVATDG